MFILINVYILSLIAGIMCNTVLLMYVRGLR